MARFLVHVCVAGILAVVSGGCGAPKSTDPRQPVEPSLDYATFVRESAERMKHAEGGPKVAVSMFLENMEGYQKKPLGKNKDTYDAIFKSAQELKQMKDRNASDAELRKGIDELVKLTEKLPSAPPPAK
jgi:hypothetical protein